MITMANILLGYSHLHFLPGGYQELHKPFQNLPWKLEEKLVPHTPASFKLQFKTINYETGSWVFVGHTRFQVRKNTDPHRSYGGPRLIGIDRPPGVPR